MKIGGWRLAWTSLAHIWVQGGPWIDFGTIWGGIVEVIFEEKLTFVGVVFSYLFETFF